LRGPTHALASTYRYGSVLESALTSLTLRIYAPVLKRQDREQYRAAANELGGIGPRTRHRRAHEVPDTMPADWSE
jgi:hypothetical protein